MTVFRLHVGDVVATPVAILVALAGLVLARRSLREQVDAGPLGLAALATYALYLAPVLLNGRWSWAGYNFVNDTSSNFIFADLLRHSGVATVASGASTTAQVEATAGGLGYPVGSHGIVTLIQPLAGAPTAAIYQPVIAFAGALSALAMGRLARGAGLRAWPAAAAGFLAAGAT